MTGTPTILDFAALDAIAFAAARGRLTDRPLPSLKATDLGPISEYVQLNAAGLLPPLSAEPTMLLDELAPLVGALGGDASVWVCPRSKMMGCLRGMPAAPTIDRDWAGFGLTAQSAAKNAGFPGKVAAQLIAAIGELYSNVYEHSNASGTGAVAFRARPGRFEFVVSDRGIGVLESLRSASEYSWLADAGEALRLTLTDGVSRFGSQSERGRGFRPLFVGLANLNGTLRFRSGDHALTIDGQSPSLMTARIAQKPTLSGFLVAVSCKTNSNRV